MKRNAKAVWQGSGMEGKGSLTTPSGAFKDHPYSFKARFKNEDGTAGTNPEELIAVAHAGCFNMALSFKLGEKGYTPDSLETKAVLTMDTEGDDFKITDIELNLEAKIPDIEDSEFQEIAKKAKEGCPVSVALGSVNITLNAKLK
ncbi:OsmC family protein [Roseivirga sp. BDSF3-8]|uniref:OsmC family protein n=1 Tax=Roseivirga sp. BDSF3-8 TaxID=3241598 RepID=UPI003532535B